MWYMGGKEVDFECRQLEYIIEQCSKPEGQSDEWDTKAGLLARIIALDQITRGAFRGTAKAFEYDPLALKYSKLVWSRGWDAVYEVSAYTTPTWCDVDLAESPKVAGCDVNSLPSITSCCHHCSIARSWTTRAKHVHEASGGTLNDEGLKFVRCIHVFRLTMSYAQDARHSYTGLHVPLAGKRSCSRH
eukprot:scaffold5988_cov381-Prasinococcus_capsulatus_cf.AAC.8